MRKEVVREGGREKGGGEGREGGKEERMEGGGRKEKM